MDTQKNTSTEEKIVKCAKGFKIASMVLYVLSCVACLTFIVLAIVLPLTCKIKGFTSVEVALIFAGLALYAFFVIGVLWNAGQIFVSIEKEKSPFGDKVTKYVKRTGVFVMLTSIVPALVQGTFVAIFVKNSDVNSSIQIGGVIAGAVLYLLGFFFKYGAELKKQNDETL